MTNILTSTRKWGNPLRYCDIFEEALMKLNRWMTWEDEQLKQPFDRRQKTRDYGSVFFICIINKLVILQDHISQPHTRMINHTLDIWKPMQIKQIAGHEFMIWRIIVTFFSVDFYIKSRISSSLHSSAWLETSGFSGETVNNATGTKKKAKIKPLQLSFL